MLGIYCRTSKSGDYSLDNQKEAGIECAKRLGLNYRVFVDDGISGTEDDSIRIGLSDLFSDIKKGQISHVYCIDQSRIERATKTWNFFVAICLSNDIKYYPGGSLFDLDNIENRMLATLMSTFNAYYTEITSKKVSIANAKKASEGKTHGIKPYGYKKDQNNNYEIDENEAVNVRRMYELSLNGVGAYSIARIFNEEGIPTKYKGNFSGFITRKNKHTSDSIQFDKSKIKWGGNVISEILRNEIYKGIRNWTKHKDIYQDQDGKLIKKKVPDQLITYDKIPIIIEPQLWNAVNSNLSINKKNVGRKEQYHYLLNGLVYCQHCGNEVIGKKRLKGRDNAYKCKSKRPPNKDCPDSRGISLPRLESFIIKHLFFSRELKEFLINAPRNVTKVTNFKNLKAIKEEELKSIKITINRLYDLLLKPGLENDDRILNDYKKYQQKHVNVIAEIEILDTKITELEDRTRNERQKSIIESYTDDIDFNSLKEKVRSLIERIDILHHKFDKIGTFMIYVKYRNYDEHSLFITDWDANVWFWNKFYQIKKDTGVVLESESELNKLLQEMHYMKKPILWEGDYNVITNNPPIVILKEDLIYFD